MRVGNGLVKLAGLCSLAGVLVAGMMFPVAGAFGMVSNRASDAVDATSTDLVKMPPPLVSVMTDRYNQPFAYIYSQYRVDTPSDKISDVMKAAMVAIEDRRFYSHSGVDWAGTVRALLSNQVNGDGNMQGASTITQQYVKNYQVLVTGRNNRLAQEQAQAPTIARKLKEARVALQLEEKLSKDEILTRYLNLVTFAGQVDGIGTASSYFFHTTPDNLTVPQAALLAGVVNNPIEFNPWAHPVKAKERRDKVIDAMVLTGKINQETGDQEKHTELGVVPDPQMPSSNCVGITPEDGFFCEYALRYLRNAGFTRDQLETGGYTIKTTLDPQIAKTTKASVEKYTPKAANGVANTFVVIRPGQQSHDVLALVANRDYGVNASAGQTLTNLPASVSDNFGTGSIYKVITSTAALEQGKAGINTVLPNPSSACYPVPQLDPNISLPCYPVSNLPNYPSSLSLQQALATSPNTAFVNLELQTGMPNVLTMASRLGLRESMKTSEAGTAPDPNSSDEKRNVPQSRYFLNKPSFTLGDSPLSPMELANVGATLASGGVWCEPNPIDQVLDHSGKPVSVHRQPCEQAVSSAVADSMMDALSQDTITGTTATAAKNAKWTRPMGGKTGTNEENRSVGFLGVLPSYAVSSMVFADGTTPQGICPPMPQVRIGCANAAFGGTVAAPPFFDAFSQILAGQPVEQLPQLDPNFRDRKNHGPVIPWVVGSAADAGADAIRAAGFNMITTEDIDSPLPKGTVVGQTPAGLDSTNTMVKLYVSTGVMPQAAGATSPAPATQDGDQPDG
ncbi:MAG: penicillin-binding protein [Kutzneria sp.]|nr:penicillin-binding protein [Kutzneria sp.]MBV9843765.1 penicillin-binding protein [Kutzneria sp.]